MRTEYRVVLDPCPLYGGIHEAERGQTLGPFTGMFAFLRAWWAAQVYVFDRPYGRAVILRAT